MIDHIGFDVCDLERSARFYDAVLFALGARRTFESNGTIAYGVTGRTFWIRALHPPPLPVPARHGRVEPGGGHVALRASGKAAVDAAHAAGVAHGGSDDGAPGPRPHYGPRYYAGYLRDPDGVRVEVVAGSGD